MITLDVATQIAQAAFAEGRVRGLVNMSVVIVDVGGNLRLAMRADGQGIFGIDIARAKATTALGFNRSTLQLAQAFSDPAKVAALSGATNGTFLPIGGGVLVQSTTGVTLGAAAVAGGAPEVDEAIIVAAIRSTGLTVPR